MKTVNKLLLATIIAAASSTAFAASTADLTVTGKIVPASCTPTFTGGGTYDFGDIPVSTLSSTLETPITPKQAGFSINCDAAAKVMISFTDNRAASAFGANPAATGHFGLGLQGANKIGYFTLQNTAGNTGDGAAVDSIESTDGGTTWAAPATGLYFKSTNKFSFAATGTVVPHAYQTYAGNFSVSPVIAPTAGMDLSSAVNLDGLATLQVTYL